MVLCKSVLEPPRCTAIQTALLHVGITCGYMPCTCSLLRRVCVCVCLCVHACVCACVHACVCVSLCNTTYALLPLPTEAAVARTSLAEEFKASAEYQEVMQQVDPIADAHRRSQDSRGKAARYRTSFPWQVCGFISVFPV